TEDEEEDEEDEEEQQEEVGFVDFSTYSWFSDIAFMTAMEQAKAVRYHDTVGTVDYPNGNSEPVELGNDSAEHIPPSRMSSSTSLVSTTLTLACMQFILPSSFLASCSTWFAYQEGSRDIFPSSKTSLHHMQAHAKAHIRLGCIVPYFWVKRRGPGWLTSRFNHATEELLMTAKIASAPDARLELNRSRIGSIAHIPCALMAVYAKPLQHYTPNRMGMYSQQGQCTKAAASWSLRATDHWFYVNRSPANLCRWPTRQVDCRMTEWQALPMKLSPKLFVMSRSYSYLADANQFTEVLEAV
ncbi:unnamed protein product, partial [Protopolystoma xenopodis]